MSLSNIFFLLILVCYLCYVRKKERILYYWVLGTSILSLLSYGLWTITKKEATLPIEGTVIQIIEKNENERWTLRSNGRKIYVYVSPIEEVHIGWKVKINGSIERTEENRVEHAFNYQKYLYYNHIDTVIKANEVSIVARGFHIFRVGEWVRQWIHQQFEEDSQAFIAALILGDDSDFDESFQESLRQNGIVHLFAVSGLHITLFISMVSQLLNRNKWTKKIINQLLFFLLFGYCIITRFSPSILRATLVYLLTQFNTKYQIELQNLDIHSLVFIFLMLINPYYLFQIGFVFSFLVSFTIVLTGQLAKQKSEIMKILFLSTTAQIITFPFIINLNYEINLLSPITNVFAILFVSSILLPCSFIVLILPIFEPLYQGLIYFFSRVSLFFSNYFQIMIHFRYIKWYYIVLYYLLIYLFIKMFYSPSVKKWIQIILVMFLFFLYQAKWFINYGTVDFLDLYYGEAILIQEPHSRSTILIDTGDGTNQVVTSFLLSQGIKKIDVLIITHAHDDHFKESDQIIKRIHVKKIITSQFNTCMDHYVQTEKVNANDRITVGNLNFYVYHPDQYYKDENDNSLVLYVEIGGLKFLFMGDLTSKEEHRIPALEVDVLKVGHHGSQFSTSESFLKKIKPEIAIIQTGRIKQFGFPNENLLFRLQAIGVTVFRTDLDYSIRYIYNRKGGIFKKLKTT